MKKKFLAAILAVSCSLSLAGCGAFEAGLQAAMEEAGIEVSGEFEVETKETKEETKESKEETKESKEETKETKEETKESKEETKEETKESKEETKESSEKPNTQAPSDLADNWDSFQVSIEGEVYQFPMWFSDFEAMGWEYDGDATDTLSSNEYSVVETWEKDGIEVYTQIANLSMNAKPLNECMIAGITFDKYNMKDSDAEIILPGGITYGVSTKEDVLEAYGTPDGEYDGTYAYSMSYELGIYQSVEISVYKESGVVEDIEIENMIEMEGLDNSVDTTVPDLVKEYEAPTSVSEDLYSYDIKLEGNYYTLPCPVSALLENGFTLNEEESDQAIGGGSYGWAVLEYDGQEYSTFVDNFADYATTPENCWLTEIETNSTYEPEFDLEIPCDIKLGDKKNDVLAKIEGFECDEYVSDNYIYYTISDPNADSWGNGYEITLKDDVVIRISVTNDEEPKY